MTILPKKNKEGEESDSEGSGEASPSPPSRPPHPSGTHGGPSRSPDTGGGPFLPASDGYYHRCVCMFHDSTTLGTVSTVHACNVMGEYVYSI